MLSNIVIAVPGNWINLIEFQNSLIKYNTGYVYAGQKLSQLETPQNFYDIEIVESNPDIIAAMEYGGHGLLDQSALAEIKNHKTIVYVIGEGGSIENVKKMMGAVSALLKSGGLGVNVESSGRASSKETWLETNDSQDISSIWTLFVQMDNENGYFYTIGMHNFGYRDLIINQASIEAKDAALLFRIFCLYNLEENPTIKNGETFSLSVTSPTYLLQEEECFLFEKEDPFYNPYGLWKMSLMHMPTRNN